MADDSAKDTEALYDEYRRLRLGGMSADQATAIVRSKKKQTQKEPVSKIESFARGAAQGALLGFGDEISGLIGATGEKILRKDGEPEREFWSDYRNIRDARRKKEQEAQEANPATYMGGQILGGVASAAPVGVPAAGVKGALATGAAYGAATGLGESRSDLAGDGVSTDKIIKAVKDTAVGAGIGAASGLIGYGAAKGIGYLGKSGAARKLADKAARSGAELSDIGKKQSQNLFLNRSDELENIVRSVDDDFRFTLGQKTGNPDIALAELKASQYPKTMRATQSAASKQIRIAARFLDEKINSIASNPAALGKSDVSEAVAKDLSRYTEGLMAQRSDAARPLYEAASKSGATVNSSGIQKAIASIADENKFSGGSVLGQLKRFSGTIQKATNEAGDMSISDIQNLRSALLRAAYNDATIIDGMSTSAQRRMAKHVLGAIDNALDETAASGSAGAEALQKANAVWRAHSQEIDNAATDTVKRLLRIGESDASDTVTDRVLRGSPEQIKGVFRILNKANPDTAQQLRAQLFDDLATKAGKPSRGSAISAELGIDKLQPASALRLLSDAEPKLQAAYAGDGRSIMALKESMEILQRLSYGPNLKGSQTAPLLAQAAEEAMGVASQAAGGRGSAVLKMVRSVLSDDRRVSEIVSSPEGLDLFRAALRDVAGRKKMTEKATNELAAIIRRPLTTLVPNQQDPDAEKEQLAGSLAQ